MAKPCAHMPAYAHLRVRVVPCDRKASHYAPVVAQMVVHMR
ncbi:hypothetical protein HMPREF9248_0424 [Fannyhessea vaginae PB189-T1-4]|uniref:Uncharacterized protein n=1 Tax=Fannyhessea vaginae PB189-T1-4 TaxID=866774 RepID=A0ABN0B134_9ACTN|nr:hypothetical protein HMPREF9248_0424 [Fannyhessea vaginae PB189-T1-4]